MRTPTLWLALVLLAACDKPRHRIAEAPTPAIGWVVFDRATETLLVLKSSGWVAV